MVVCGGNRWVVVVVGCGSATGEALTDKAHTQTKQWAGVGAVAWGGRWSADGRLMVDWLDALRSGTRNARRSDAASKLWVWRANVQHVPYGRGRGRGRGEIWHAFGHGESVC